MYLLLIITLATGAIEIRQEASFRSHDDCTRYMRQRLERLDIRRGDSVVACLPADQFDGALRLMFGSRS